MVDITPYMVIKNEEYFLGYILRELCKVFPRVIVIDTMSTDNTPTIAKSFPQVAFFQYDMKKSDSICPARQWGLDMIETEWSFLVDGDEYYEEAELLKFKQLVIEDGKKMGFTAVFALDFAGDQFYIRGQMSANRIFKTKETRWSDHKHPWETVDSWGEKETHFYTQVRGWHMRQLSRSSRDHDTYFRIHKLNFWEKTRWDLLERNPFAPIEGWKNPYLEALKDVVTA